jgi:hypothetical protein
MADIIDELPKLTHQQRREICQRIISLEAEQEDISACDATALAGFALLDQMEAEDAARAKRKEA